MPLSKGGSLTWHAVLSSRIICRHLLYGVINDLLKCEFCILQTYSFLSYMVGWMGQLITVIAMPIRIGLGGVQKILTV